MDFTYTIWIILLPFIGFLLIGLFMKKLPPIASALVGTTAILGSSILSFVTVYKYFLQGAKLDGAWEQIIGFRQTFINFNENLHFDLGTLIDPISVMMLVVVSVVSLMVHIYSIGYMKGEDGYYRYFAYLGLFTMSMFGLVLATNLFQIYFFWELVGVSSYLLIGFYYKKPSAVSASKKAFIVTRFADLGFLLGILLMSFHTGTFDFIELTAADGPVLTSTTAGTFMGLSVLTWALLLMFMGGAGKSAMFPLHIWLPDAMEGPTPVSALIHAATMVVAGVYLVGRMFPLFHGLDHGFALHVVAVVGAFSSLFAAIIAMTQMDIKRVLAFSTMSQIGYMMLALGVSGYEGHHGLGYMAAMFHLFTHAMFKALLFLGAGAIIHAVHSNLMTSMGGLRKHLPVTHITFLIACLAISGIPPFSGFFSKDEILVAAFEHNKILFFVEYIVAGMTAFYMFRIYFKVFWGVERKYEHAHEGPLAMTIPLIILAFLTVVIGWAIPFSDLVSADRMGFETHLHYGLAAASVGIGVLGIFVAWWMYKNETDRADKLANSFGALYRWASDKFYIDEVYNFITHKIIFNGISRPIAWFDRNVVDGAMNGIGWLTTKSSEEIKGVQSGKVQDYGFGFVAAVVAFVLAFLYFIQ